MKSFIIYIIFFLGLSCIAISQEDLEVIVTDLSSGKPLENILVHITNNSIGFDDQAITNSDGKVTFKALAVVGGYTVKVSDSEAYSTMISDQIDLRSNYSPTIRLPLEKKSKVLVDEITISAYSTTKINSANAEVSSDLKEKEIKELPIEGRDVTRVLYRMPHVTQATGFYPEAPNVSINGANSLYTNYLIDGLDNNEQFLGGQKFAMPVGFSRNINVMTNTFSSEFGWTGNGVVNLTSKSGNNDYSGEVFVISRPGPVIDGKSQFAQRDLSGNQVKDGFQRYQMGFGVGGPIKKDKTFYYLNLEHTIDLKDNLLNSPQLGVNETVRGDNRFTYFSGKLDHWWNKKTRSTLRMNIGAVNIERQGGGLEGGVAFPSSANSQDRNSVLIASRNVYLGENFSSETNFQFSSFRWNYGKPSNEGSPQVVVLAPDDQTIAVLGHPGYIFDQKENTQQVQQKFTYYTGNHKLKAGIDIITSGHSLFGGGNVNGNYTIKLNQFELDALRNQNLGAAINIGDIPTSATVLNYNVELQPNKFGKRQNLFSIYVEDQFSLNEKLNLHIGLRYDYDNLSKGGSDKGDLNNVGPRLSINYAIGNNSSLRAGYGIVYDKIIYAIYSDALQQNTTSGDYRKQLQQLIDLSILPIDTDLDKIIFEGNLTASASNVDYLNGPVSSDLQDQRDQLFSNERRILNPNGYQNPFTQQISVGYQKQVNRHTLFYIDLVHNRTNNLFRLRDLNNPQSYSINDPLNVIVRSQSEADLTRPVPIFQNPAGSITILNDDTLYGIARSVIVSETEGKSRYYAASFNLQKDRAEKNVSYRLIYTLSYLNNNTEDINFRAMDSNNFEDEWGPSINDRTHVINGIINYYPFKGFVTTIAGLLQSGQPINRIPDATLYGTTDLNGDGRSFGDAYVGNSDRYPGESRNSDRLPWSTTFDFSVLYEIGISTNGILELRADVFNIFNAQNLSGYSNNATQSNQIQAGSKSSGVLVRRNASAPRQFQFGIQYSF